MRFSARFIFGALISLILFCFVTISPAHAQNYTVDTDPNVPSTLHNYTQTVFLEILSTIGCQLDGIDLANIHEPCLGLNPKSGKIGYIQSGGLIGMTSNMMGMLYTPPAHFTDFTHDLTQNFGIVKQSYAQGVGYESISPLIDIWKIFRNMVYLIFVLIFAIVGLLVMLRVHIDPRTVMSIENQLPKLIIGLILVTFSFAIAGAMIDAMWVLTFLVINILTPNLHNFSASQTNASIFQNPFGFYNNVAPGGVMGVAFGSAGSASDIFRNLFTPANSDRLGLVPSTQACVNNTPVIGLIGTGFCNLGGAITNAISGAVGFVVAWILDIVVTVVVLIAILVALFRVWFSLLMAYLYILLDIVLGPFYIIFGAIPGSKISFTAWLRDLAANLISFPTIIAIFLLGRLFMESFVAQGGAQGQTQALFVPPLIGNPNGGANTTNPLGWLIGLAIVLVTPGIVNTMKELFKAPQNKLGAQVFQNLAMGGKAFGGLAKGIFSTLTSNDIRYEETPNGAQMHVIQGAPAKALNQLKKVFGGR